jgi:dephospho-CoA kinase
MKGLVRIGLTGGIATGKSTVAARWQAAGAAIIDADRLAHQTLEPDTPTWSEVVRVFGEAILNEDRTVNRRRLGEIVFGDEQQRLALNHIVHPAVRRRWNEALDALEQDPRADTAVAVIPLLFEVGAETEFHHVVAVGCSETTQLARLAANGLTAPQARVRIRAQWPIQMKLDRAEFVIWNDGSPAVLNRQADITWASIKEDRHAPSQN